MARAIDSASLCIMTVEIGGMVSVEGFAVGRVVGVSDGIRTHGPRVHSPMLYR